MPRLLTTDFIRARLYLTDIDSVNEAIGETLDGVTEVLESALRTGFDQVTGQQDLFFVSRSTSIGLRRSTYLQLRQGLVDESINPVRVESASVARTFVDGTPTDLRDPVDEFVVVHAEKGLVLVQDANLSGRYVRVTYDAGIPLDPNDPDLYDQSAVPPFLKELAMLTTAKFLEGNPTLGTSAEDGARGRPANLDILKKKLESMLDVHTRYEPKAIQPV